VCLGHGTFGANNVITASIDVKLASDIDGFVTESKSINRDKKHALPGIANAIPAIIYQGAHVKNQMLCESRGSKSENDFQNRLLCSLRVKSMK